MGEPVETLRQRAERFYNDRVTNDPVLRSTWDRSVPRPPNQDDFIVYVHLMAALRATLLDLAEELDQRLGANESAA